jgi:hypothetical protein
MLFPLYLIMLSRSSLFQIPFLRSSGSNRAKPRQACLPGYGRSVTHAHTLDEKHGHDRDKPGPEKNAHILRDE